ncbi:small ribosomal subunit protein bS6-like [Convolutriloba macropyga]|uniref:small ribosomal subunit protein bS6-like n=1 Tax=Convolutriloba macropyga TaxID=536237 RepID=UPI003F52261D
MPLYQLFAIAKPQVPLSALAVAMKKVGTAVFKAGGVVTEIRSYGKTDLAYKLKTQTGKYGSGQMFQLNFLVRPTTLNDINHDLKVNEDVLRWVVLKEKQYITLPRTVKELRRLEEDVEEFESNPFPPLPEYETDSDEDISDKDISDEDQAVLLKDTLRLD